MGNFLRFGLTAGFLGLCAAVASSAPADPLLDPPPGFLRDPLGWFSAATPLVRSALTLFFAICGALFLIDRGRSGDRARQGLASHRIAS